MNNGKRGVDGHAGFDGQVPEAAEMQHRRGSGHERMHGHMLCGARWSRRGSPGATRWGILDASFRSQNQAWPLPALQRHQPQGERK